jgi:hypothetical protein
MDDVLEFCGERSWAYNTAIIEPLIAGCRDTAPANRQAAAYGIGVAAHKGGPQWSQFLGAAVEVLFQVTQFPNARGDDDVYATENACAAIAKVMYRLSKTSNRSSLNGSTLCPLSMTRRLRHMLMPTFLSSSTSKFMPR